MSFEIKPVAGFRKDFKLLSKKYKKLDDDVKKVILELKENPKAGSDLGYNCYKIRMANSSASTGKSGGFRLIYYFIDEQNNLYLMNIYSKTKKENISENELLELLKINGLDK
ncbi:MAG: type II toxin-antitoxin system RelE/ParE family toxin [Campylobacterota bacterium]|nr:type II toxin-antitoxin system RelE/ParE family toxin [Campylobacterota bacterium]